MNSLEQINALVAKHNECRANRHFLMADQIRNELLGQGIVIKGDDWDITRWRATCAGPLVGSFKFDTVTAFWKKEDAKKSKSEMEK